MFSCICLSLTNGTCGAGIAYREYATGRTIWGSFPSRSNSKTSSRIPMLTQPPIVYWRVSSPGMNRPGRKADHLHLVPRFRMSAVTPRKIFLDCSTGKLPETSVTSYQPTPRNIGKRRCHTDTPSIYLQGVVIRKSGALVGEWVPTLGADQWRLARYVRNAGSVGLLRFHCPPACPSPHPPTTAAATAECTTWRRLLK